MTLKKPRYKKAFSPSYLPRQPFTPYKPVYKPYNPGNGGKDIGDIIKNNKKVYTVYEGLRASNKWLSYLSMAATSPLGQGLIGHLWNTATSLLHNSKDRLPYLEKETLKNLLTGNAEDTTRVHYIRFHIGFSSTKSVLAAENQFGSVKLELTNSLSDATETIPRSFLARSFGFNQKSIDFLGPKFYGTVNDYNKIYAISNWKPGDDSYEVPYGLVKEEQSQLKIRNSNTYHSIRVKLHLVKLLDDNINMGYLYSSTFSENVTKQNKGAIPVMYQISNLQTESNAYLQSCTCHLTATLGLSSNFKCKARVEKTFSKTLGPGDTLDFKMTHHCGPGIRFDVAQSLLESGFAGGDQPSCYGMIVEVSGTPCEGVRFSDNSVFQGTCPGYYNYEYRKIIVPVRHNTILGDSSQIGGKTFKKKYAIKVYEQQRLKDRPFNVYPHHIGEKGEEGKLFGVISVSSERPVYSGDITKKAEEETSFPPELNIEEVLKEIEEDLDESEEGEW